MATKKTKKKVPCKVKSGKIKAKKPEKKEKDAVIGVVTHYFPKVRAAAIKLGKPLSIGDMIRIKGHTTNITQQVNSMQIDRVAVHTAKKGKEIGILAESRVRPADIVYKITA